MIVFYKIPMEVWVVAPRLSGPTEEKGERLDAAESTQSEGCRGLQMLRARSLIHVGVGASACTSKRDLGFSQNPCEPGQAVAVNSRSVAQTEGSGYVSTCAVEGMETNSRRMFLAISILFCAIISAFWMSW